MVKPLPKRARLALPIALAALSLAAVFWIEATHNNRGHYTGDDFSSQAVYWGGKNLERFGFARLKGLPVQVPVREATLVDEDLRGRAYTHYPPGADIFQYVLTRLGLESWQGRRAVAILVTAFGALFLGLFLKSALGYGAGFAALAFWLLSPSTLFFSDSLQQFPWFMLLKGLAIYRLWRIHEDVALGLPAFSKAWVFEFLAIGFAGAWFSFDAVPSLAAIGLALPWIVGSARKFGNPELAAASDAREVRKFGVSRLTLLLMLAMPLGEILGFVLHIAQNATLLGSWDAAVADMTHAFFERRGVDVAVEYNLGKHLTKLFLGLQWFFTWPLIALAAIGWWHGPRRARDVGFWRGIGIATFIGAIAWQFMLPQHGLVHAFTYRHFDFWIVLGVGLFSLGAIHGSKPAAWRALLIAVSSSFALHTGMAIAQWEGESTKESIIRTLVSEEHRLDWACTQAPRLANSTELPGAKAIVSRLLAGDDCSVPRAAQCSGLGCRLAELALYWR